MGEAKRRKSTTAKFISAHPYCALCGGLRDSETREHFPPTNLFDRFQRPDSVVVPACKACNIGSALSDLVAGFISRIGFDNPSEQVLLDGRVLLGKLNNRRPEMVREMMNLGPSARKRGFNQLRELGLDVPLGSKAMAITGEMFQLLHVFGHKAVLCHYFARVGRPLSEAGGVICYLKMKESVATGEIPEEVFKPLGPLSSLRQGVKDFGSAYQFREATGEDGTYGIAARFRVGFMIVGYALGDLRDIPEKQRDGFLHPSQLFSILTNDRYKWYDQFSKRADAA